MKGTFKTDTLMDLISEALGEIKEYRKMFKDLATMYREEALDEAAMISLRNSNSISQLSTNHTHYENANGMIYAGTLNLCPSKYLDIKLPKYEEDFQHPLTTFTNAKEAILVCNDIICKLDALLGLVLDTETIELTDSEIETLDSYVNVCKVK
jgi:hypothetical protein